MSTDDLTKPETLVAAAIDAAEDIRDPLERLVEKTTTDPGAPFVPDVLEALAALTTEDRAAFEVLRAQLKKVGCRVTALDEAIAEESGETGGRGPTQADILIELAQSAELFHTPDSTGFADIDISGHRATWPIRAKGFRRWLARKYLSPSPPTRIWTTRSGASKCALWTDQDEVLFDGQRPIILNGIEDIVTRADLADRALLLTLEPIPKGRRRSEKDLWVAFEAEHPRILGALLDAVVEGLRRLPNTRLDELPRMADFALWATELRDGDLDPGHLLEGILRQS
jgi:hypothetical protein